MNPDTHEPIPAAVREVARAEAQAETRRFLDLFKPKADGTEPAKSRTAIWVSIAVAILLSVFGAWKSGWKEPIVIPPLNPAATQSQPLVLVVNLPAGATVSAAPTASK